MQIFFVAAYLKKSFQQTWHKHVLETNTHQLANAS